MDIGKRRAGIRAVPAVGVRDGPGGDWALQPWGAAVRRGLIRPPRAALGVLVARALIRVVSVVPMAR